MRSVAVALAPIALLALGCPEKPPAPPQVQPVQRAPLPSPRDFDAGTPTHLRPAPKAGSVTKEADGTLVLKGHREAIMAVAFSPDGRRVATGGMDRTVRVFDLEAGTEVFFTQQGDEAVTALEFSPRGDLLAAGERALQVRLIATDGGTLVRVQPHPDAVSSVSFSPDGAWLAVAGARGIAEVYAVEKEGPSKCELKGRTVDFTEGGKQLVSARQENTLLVTDFPSCKLKKETSTGDQVPLASASGKSTLVATRSGREGLVLLWDAVGGRMLGKLEGHQAGVTSVELSKDGKWALTAAEDRSVRLWDLEKRAAVKTFETGGLPFAALSPDAKRAVIADGVEAKVVDLSPAP